MRCHRRSVYRIGCAHVTLGRAYRDQFDHAYFRTKVYICSRACLFHGCKTEWQSRINATCGLEVRKQQQTSVGKLGQHKRCFVGLTLRAYCRKIYTHNFVLYADKMCSPKISLKQKVQNQTQRGENRWTTISSHRFGSPERTLQIDSIDVGCFTG